MTTTRSQQLSNLDVEGETPCSLSAGTWELVGEKRPLSISFHPEYKTMSVVVSQAAEPLRLAWNLSRHVLSDLILSKDDLIKMDLTQSFEGTENPSDKHKTQKPYITSIDYECDGVDSYCLLVGSSSGQGMWYVLSASISCTSVKITRCMLQFKQ